MIAPNLRKLFLAISMSLLSACQATLFGALGVAGRSNQVEIHQGIVFNESSQLALDVYRPIDSHDAPVVVFFYGGSWKDGKRSWYRFVGESLARKGLVVVIPDYRKYPQVRFPAFMQDAADAVRWTRDHASDLGGNTAAMFLMGHSAGAQIAALLLTDERYLKAVSMRRCDLSGFIGLAGPYDFAPTSDPELKAIFGDTDAEQRLSQPVAHVDGCEPPMLLLHGSSDNTVWPSNSQALADKLRVAGDDEQLILYPGIGHVKLLLSLAPAFSRWSNALDDTVKFINEKSISPSPILQRSSP